MDRPANARRIGILALICAIGVSAYVYQLINGLGVTGLNRPVVWSFYIINCIFCSQHKYWRIYLFLAQRATDFGSTFFRHHDIQNNKII